MSRLSHLISIIRSRLFRHAQCILLACSTEASICIHIHVHAYMPRYAGHVLLCSTYTHISSTYQVTDMIYNTTSQQVSSLNTPSNRHESCANNTSHHDNRFQSCAYPGLYSFPTSMPSYSSRRCLVSSTRCHFAQGFSHTEYSTFRRNWALRFHPLIGHSKHFFLLSWSLALYTLCRCAWLSRNTSTFVYAPKSGLLAEILDSQSILYHKCSLDG